MSKVLDKFDRKRDLSEEEDVMSSLNEADVENIKPAKKLKAVVGKLLHIFQMATFVEVVI